MFRSRAAVSLLAAGVGLAFSSMAQPKRAVSPLMTAYRGSPAAAAALNGGRARPLGLATADFNSDGVPDLAAAYDMAPGGALAVHFGAIAKAGQPPFRAEAAALDTPERPDFVAAGDFDGDDRFDVVTAAIGSDRLYFFAGDGKGAFAAPRPIALPGRVTAFMSGEVNRADGLTDLVVAVSSPYGHKLLVFESPRGALNGEPEAIALPAAATRLRLAPSEKWFYDVVVDTADATYTALGRDRKLALPEPLRKDVAAMELVRAARRMPVEAPATGVAASLRLHSGNGVDQVELVEGKVAPMLSVLTGVTGFVVNSTADTADGDVTDGVCDTGRSPNFTGICTLRAAIQQVDHNGGGTITFSTAVTTIAPVLQLPDVTVNATIDGLSGRTSRVQLDGRSVTGGGEQIYDPAGISLYGGNSTLTGMTIFGFSAQVKVASSNSGGNTIQSNWIGVDNTGHIPTGRTQVYGILLEGYPNAGNNLVGGTALGQGNVISTGNANGYGIVINSDGNQLQGNFIGTDPSGATLLGNGRAIAIGDCNANVVGGTTTGAGNVIAGNATFAAGSVQITQANALTQNNRVQGNLIGTDATGSVALGGGNGGVYVSAPFTTIGGTTALARNVISGNGAYGVTIAQANALVEGNYIGTDMSGSTALANGCCGVQVQYAGTIVGGTGGAGNLISGNSGPGVTLNQSFTSNVQVVGNIIGLNAAGTAALANTGDGLNVQNVSSSGEMFQGNVISGNGGNGIYTEAGSVTIQGNLIGTNAAGSAAIGNGAKGVLINSGNPVTIGGASAGQGNVISGNASDGVGMTADFNFTVQGNLIGLDSTGSAALGNGGNGLFIGGGFIAGNCGNCASYYGNVQGNTIANNSSSGIDEDYAFQTVFRGNSMYANTTAGITQNNGSNNSIAAPVLSGAYINGSTLLVAGSISSAPLGYPATLEIFSSNAADSIPEGRTSLGTATVSQTGSFVLSVPSAGAQVVNATVTDNGGDTSKFSNAVTAQSCGTDISSRLSVAKGGIRYSGGKFLQGDTVTNTSGAPIAAPIYLAIDNLSSNATLANAAGSAICSTPASPYVTVLSSGSLAAGASVTLQLQFNDPSLASFTYSTRVFGGRP